MERREVIVVVLMLLIVSAFSYYFILGKTCKDEACFDKAARNCRPATFLKENNGNTFKYEIKYSLSSDCRLVISVDSISKTVPKDIALLFAGKSMQCLVPKNAFSSEFLELNSALDYCHGPLKEAMYELMIQKLYNLAANQLGSVILETQKALEEK